MTTPKDQLIDIWKATFTKKHEDGTPIHNEKHKTLDQKEQALEEARLEAVLQSFLKTCETYKDSIRSAFNEILDAQDNHYPWDYPVFTSQGRAWTERLSLAALELPNFLDEKCTEKETHAEKVEAEIKRIVTGEQGWDLQVNEDFQRALSRAIVILAPTEIKK
jgi:hypothetical protein